MANCFMPEEFFEIAKPLLPRDKPSRANFVCRIDRWK